ncbi:MAG: UvrD-helicase domain-containing protein [Victivallales bacterium]|nr:UvrD-helicase domain-containing protein [Victivallales bacterium]MBT7303373.1 UvrD-helicase domain-containing protein [Victivallales bacterium]
MTDLLTDLTDAQREAVTHMEGPMLVVAGAGSGKTRVVTRRIAHLVSKGIWPSQILAMTFTNKAAREMRERVEELVGESPRWVGTFHSACAKLLRRDLGKLEEGRDGKFTIYDTDDQRSVVRLCLKELGIKSKEYSPSQLQGEISRAKSAMLSSADIASEDGYGTSILPQVFAAYENRMRDLNAVDFDDLLLLTVRLLEARPDIQDVYHSRFRYLLIDEYQDTNRTQYELMRLLTGPAQNVHVTGDPDQSIYSWRGADYRNIMDFTTDYPNARVVRLEQNYRSTQNILEAANTVIRFNTRRIEKELFTENEVGTSVKVVELKDERDEGRLVAARVAELRLDGEPLQDMAVFYRTNAQSRALEEALLRASVPYRILGGLRFYERKEVKDILAHLQLMVNPRDAISLQRVVECRPTGVGSATLARVTAAAASERLPVFHFLQMDDFAKQIGGRITQRVREFGTWCRELAGIEQSPVGACVRAVIDHSGLVELYQEKTETDPQASNRLENLNALIERGTTYEDDHPQGTLAEFLEEVSLVADVDNHDRDADALTLMTLHSSKGLEFPFVFIVGLEEGYLPHANCSDDPDQVEEERRLFYVGLTRAQKEAIVSFVQSRYMWGQADFRIPSRFLQELPKESIEHANLGAVRPW